MIPVVTPAEMAAIDAAAPDPVDVLIERAGAAVARAAQRLMGGSYGRVVNVVAGNGNNGNDGRVAGRRLAERGVHVRVFDVAGCPATLPPCDLVIDAAFGTGFRGEWAAPDVGGATVLAVDIPSGVDGLTGAAVPGAVVAAETVTFAALKPGLLLGDGARLAGRVTVADIGLDVSRAPAHVVTERDVAEWWPRRPVDAHKWDRALRVIAGSAGMTGAARLCSSAAMRAGAGIVWLSSPGIEAAVPTEVVGRPLPASGWARVALTTIDRFGAMVVGPGLGRAEPTMAALIDAVAQAPLPVLVDGDGLVALGRAGRDVLSSRTQPTVLTPHDGEFAVLVGRAPEADRLAAARRAAADWSSVVLLKGPATVVADPDGRVLIVDEGDERLATAGTGDVLAGIIGALLAGGVNAFHAAAGGAWLHARAGRLRPGPGLVAGDLVDAIPGAVADLENDGARRLA